MVGSGGAAKSAARWKMKCIGCLTGVCNRNSCLLESVWIVCNGVVQYSGKWGGSGGRYLATANIWLLPFLTERYKYVCSYSRLEGNTYLALLTELNNYLIGSRLVMPSHALGETHSAELGFCFSWIKTATDGMSRKGDWI